MTLNNPLNIPLRIDATYSDGSAKITPPVTDFSLLNQTIPPDGGNMSDTQPWLGNTASSEAANSYNLSEGVHLHWTLPKALRSGVSIYVLNDPVYNELVQQGVPWSLVQILRQSAGTRNEYTLDQINTLLNGLVTSPQCPGIPDLQNSYQKIGNINSDDPNIAVYSYLPKFAWDPILLQIYGPIVVKYAAQMKMLPAPNRWLIIRSDTQKNYCSWVLESDRLSYPQLNAPPAAPDVTYLNNPVVINSFSDDSVKVPQALDGIYQYLGAYFEASVWTEDESANRVAPLTCLGNGAPEFASSYTNCYGVFGFCDSSVVNNSAEYTYTVLGWYSNPNDDPMSSSFTVLPWSLQNTNPTEMMAALNWGTTATDLSIIEGSIYTATINVTGSNCAANQELPSLMNTNVSIGNTAAEALSASISQSPANKVTGALGVSAETLLNATQTGQTPKTLSPDGTALIENSLHQSAFQSGVNGCLWEVRPLPSDQQPKTPVALPQNTAANLSTLNECQLQFDRTQSYLIGERLNLFTDWCRAIHLETDEASFGATDPITPQSKSTSILTQSSLSIDAAGMGFSPVSSGDLFPQSLISYQALCALYNAFNTIQNDLNNTAYYLKQVPAPRHFSANDPHIMMSELAGQSNPCPLTVTPTDVLAYTQGVLSCSITSASPVPAIPTNAQTQFSTWVSNPQPNTPNINCVFNYILNSPPCQTAVYSWRPLYLQWQASFFPCANGTGGLVPGQPGNLPTFADYSASFLTENFEFDSNGIEYIKLPTTQFNSQACTYNGRVVLTSNTMQTMKNQILQLCGLPLSNPPSTISASDLPGLLGTDANATALITSAYAQNANTLSQMLDGFSDRLLMLNKISQISIFDPNGPIGLMNKYNGEWDASSQSNYVEIGLQHTYSPQQSDAYNPIRAGKCEITSINLIDAFGQKITWNLTTDNLFISNTFENMTDHTAQSPAPALLLPPRILQDSRILFRWITANSTLEANNLPESSPVCGWVALNRVDETILFFNADGNIYGYIDPSTGTFTKISTSQQQINSYLDQIVTQASSTTFATNFYQDIDDTLLTIDPFSHQSTDARSVLISRPLAIAQASINLELLGAPSGHQGYEWLQTLNLNTSNYAPTDASSPVFGTTSPFIQRQTCGFTDVQVPVNLGDASMANDGLLLYWNIGSQKISNAYTLVSNQGGASSLLMLTCDPANPGINVLMLCDPRAPIHLTSCLLPTKSISIPPQFYSEALRSMEYQMSVSPLITPYDPDNNITLPIPKEVTGTWVWKDSQSSVTTQAVKDSDDKVHLQNVPSSILNGILQFNQIEE